MPPAARRNATVDAPTASRDGDVDARAIGARLSATRARARARKTTVGRRKSSVDDLARVGSGGSRARATRGYGSDDEDERRGVGAIAGVGGGLVGGGSDASRRDALERRLAKMRTLPKGSRYARRQCELMEKALEILVRVKARGGGKTTEEEDELAGLLRAVKL